MISNTAIVEAAEIGSNVSIGEYAVIRPGVKIGSNVVIHPHVIVYQDSIIGDNCIIHPNVVINSGVTLGRDVEVFPGTVIGKAPKGAGATVRPIDYDPHVVIGDECAIGPNAVIYCDVKIGSNTLIGDGGSLREQVRVGHHCIISRYVTVNYNTTIGDHTKIMDLTHVTGNAFIGDHVFVSLLVATTNDNVVTAQTYDEEAIKGPYIGNHATIGAGANLLPNVKIGEGAFVAASALVTKDVEPWCMVMGVPAKFVRKVEQN